MQQRGLKRKADTYSNIDPILRYQYLRRKENADARNVAVAQAKLYRSMPSNKLQYQRSGYDSVFRSRGAAVTGEMKYFDCYRTHTAITALNNSWDANTRQDPTATVDLGGAAVNTPACLFAPQVGSALNQRIGRKCRMLKVKVRGSVFVPVQSGQSTADGALICRILLVLDMQTNSTQMTPSDLLLGADAGLNTVYCFQNPSNFGRFQILKERYITFRDLNLTAAAPSIIQGGSMYTFKMNYSFPTGGLLVNFNAVNGGTVADISDNSIHVLAGASSASYVQTIGYYSRVCFKE